MMLIEGTVKKQKAKSKTVMGATHQLDRDRQEASEKNTPLHDKQTFLHCLQNQEARSEKRMRVCRQRATRKRMETENENEKRKTKNENEKRENE